MKSFHALRKLGGEAFSQRFLEGNESELMF